MYQYSFQFRKSYFQQFSIEFNCKTNTGIVNIGKVLTEKFSKWVCYIQVTLVSHHSESLDEESFSTTGSLLEDALPERNQDDKTIMVQKKDREAREPHCSPE